MTVFEDVNTSCTIYKQVVMMRMREFYSWLGMDTLKQLVEKLISSFCSYTEKPGTQERI